MPVISIKKGNSQEALRNYSKIGTGHQQGGLEKSKLTIYRKGRKYENSKIKDIEVTPKRPKSRSV